MGLALLYLDNYIRGTGWNSLEEPPGGNVREDFTTGSVECDAAIKRWRPGGLATTVYSRCSPSLFALLDCSRSFETILQSEWKD